MVSSRSANEPYTLNFREFNLDKDDNLCAWFTFTHVWDKQGEGRSSIGTFRNECRFYRDCPEVERCVSPARCKSGKAICSAGLI